MGSVTAACAGQSALFGSTAIEDHQQAAAICGGCDFIERCREIRDLPDRGGGYMWHHGTWAGELWHDGHRIDPVSGARVANQRPVRNCGLCGEKLPEKAHVTQRFCSGCREARAAQRQAAYDERRRQAGERRKVPSNHYGETNDLACPKCNAAPGKPCAIPRTDRAGMRIVSMHAARRTAPLASVA